MVDLDAVALTIISALSFILVISFFIFIIIQAVTPKWLNDALKPKNWRHALTQKKEFSVIGYFLIASQFIGGILTFSSIIYSILLWTELISIREAIMFGFLVNFIFWAIWMKFEKAQN